MGDFSRDYSLLQMKLEKDDIIYCLFKHPECHYERDLYCVEIDIKPDVNWFGKPNTAKEYQGKCTYTEFACYVFDYIFTELITKNITLEDNCLLSTRDLGPLIIYAYLKRKLSDDEEYYVFKMRLETDGTSLEKMFFTIL